MTFCSLIAARCRSMFFRDLRLVRLPEEEISEVSQVGKTL